VCGTVYSFLSLELEPVPFRKLRNKAGLIKHVTHLLRLKIMLEENGSIKENRPTSSS
jgi:hypothetical protein